MKGEGASLMGEIREANGATIDDLARRNARNKELIV